MMTWRPGAGNEEDGESESNAGEETGEYDCDDPRDEDYYG